MPRHSPRRCPSKGRFMPNQERREDGFWLYWFSRHRETNLRLELLSRRSRRLGLHATWHCRYGPPSQPSPSCCKVTLRRCCPTRQSQDGASAVLAARLGLGSARNTACRAALHATRTGQVSVTFGLRSRRRPARHLASTLPRPGWSLQSRCRASPSASCVSKSSNFTSVQVRQKRQISFPQSARKVHETSLKHIHSSEFCVGQRLL